VTTYDQDLVNLATTQFTANTELLLQQEGSLLRQHVREGAHVGKMASPINQISPIQAKAPAGRFAPKERVPNTFTRRWVFPNPYEDDQYIDSFDELMTIVDPKSEYVRNAAYAMGRAIDDLIMQAAVGTAQTGTDAASLAAESFTSTYQIAANFNASSSVGLTVDKLIKLRQNFRHYHVDIKSDPVTLIIGSQQEADLLNQVEVVSTEFNDRPVLVDGSITRFLGFNIVVSERVPQTTAGSVRGCIAFSRSGMYLGLWKDISNQAFQRSDLSGNPWDLSTTGMIGATRTQLGKVWQVLCADTTGSDTTP